MAAQDSSWNPDQADREFYKRLLDNLHDGVYFVNRERRIVYWNEGAVRLTGFGREEVLGHLCHDNLLSHTDVAGQQFCPGNCPLTATMGDGRMREAQVFLRHKCGRQVAVHVRVTPILNDQREIVGAVEVFSDDTPRHTVTRRAEELERLAFRDALTQVANRRYVEVRLQAAFQEYQLHQDPFGLLLIDVDHFKQINDQYGHEAGDRALVSLTQTLSRVLRSTDLLGRWGGDEFLAIVAHISANNLWQLACRCCALVALTRVPRGEEEESFPISISVGGSLFRGEGTIEDLIARADKLLYVSKERGRARATVERV